MDDRYKFGRFPVLYLFGSLIFQIWGGYLIGRGLVGDDVFTSSFSYVGSIGIVLLALGLGVLCVDILGLLLLFFMPEDQVGVPILGSEGWSLSIFFVETLALLAVGYGVIGMIKLFHFIEGRLPKPRKSAAQAG